MNDDMINARTIAVLYEKNMILALVHVDTQNARKNPT